MVVTYVQSGEARHIYLMRQMSANNQNLGSDLTKVDSHEISSDEYDELPDLTELGIEHGVWKIAGKEVSSLEGKIAFNSESKK
jgi:hypothetical protein